MRAGRAVEIPVFPLISLIQKENLGQPHPVFAGGERYVSPRFAAEAERVIERELKEAGIGDYPDFVDLVGVVQRAEVEYYGWVTTSAESSGLLVASVGRSTVLLTRSGEQIRFERCDFDRALDSFVSRLPETPAARGDSFSVGHSEFHTPRSRVAGSVLRRSAPARPEGARKLDALLDTQRLSVAKLYAAKRNGDGDRQRSAQWLTVLDLVAGRWAISVTRSRHGRWITVAPGSPQVVADQLAELARSIR
jgi:hypothetical protein